VRKAADRLQHAGGASGDAVVALGQRRRELLFGALFLASGVALLVYILSGISLGLTLVLLTIGAVVVQVRVHRVLPAARRAELARRVRAGAVAGVAGLAAYDSSRWLLVQVFHFQFKPFDVFYTFGAAIFGQSMLGPGSPAWLALAVGVAFHVVNGLGFAMAYAVWAGRKGPVPGIVFALFLQVLMVAIYPSWLRIQMMGEFLEVSMLGHVAYGAAIGAVSRFLLSRPSRA
jgi:hypothetical protein